MAEVQHRSQEGKCNYQYVGTADKDQSVGVKQRQAH